MFNFLKSYIQWAEKAAYEDELAAYEDEEIAASSFLLENIPPSLPLLPNPDADITLDRLWTVCKKYARGSNSFHNKLHGNQWININIHSSSSNKRDNNALMIIFSIVFLGMWLVSGIAFKRVFTACVDYITKIGQTIGGGGMRVFGAVMGMNIAAIAGAFLKPIYGHPYTSYLQTGLDIGNEYGLAVGKLVGYLAAISPAVVIGGSFGIAAGLPMGALTIIIGSIQGIKATSNTIIGIGSSINNKFHKVLQSNNKLKLNTSDAVPLLEEEEEKEEKATNLDSPQLLVSQPLPFTPRYDVSGESNQPQSINKEYEPRPTYPY